MKRFVVTMVLVLIAGAACIAVYYGVRKPAAPPNVVFILLDALREDRLDALRDGHPVMPNICALAGEGVRFDDTVTVCTWTKPAMATVFTGLPVDAHGVYFAARELPQGNVSDVLPESMETLAEWFRARDYATFGVQTNANCTRELGFAQGYDRHDYRFNNGALAPWVVTQALGAVYAMDAPFFLYTHFMDPHAPYTPPPDYQPPWTPVQGVPAREQAMLEDNDRFMAYYRDCAFTAIGLQQERRLPPLSEAGEAWVRERYDAATHAMDAAVGRMVNEIRQYFPNTVFIVTSDHGEEFWERGGMGHGTTLHAEQLRVPLIIAGPGITPAVNETPASLIDLAPTIAAYLDAPPLEVWQGRNLFAPAPDNHARFARTRGVTYPDLQVDLAGVIEGAEKLIVDYLHNTRLLYDRVADPADQHNLAKSKPGQVESLTRLIERHQEAGSQVAGYTPPKAVAMEPAQQEALEALGYLGGAEEPRTPDNNTGALAPHMP
ncbi:MAG: sulfatase [Candidatus Hydrogenedentota bacterium]